MYETQWRERNVYEWAHLVLAWMATMQRATQSTSAMDAFFTHVRSVSLHIATKAETVTLIERWTKCTKPPSRELL